MNEKWAQQISLFFYFALLDRGRAIDCSAKAFDRFKKSLKLDHHLDQEKLVDAINSIWKKIDLSEFRGRILPANESLWTIPHDIDLGPWRKFQKVASKEELEVILFKQVLGLQDQFVAAGLEISEGTYRQRLAKAHKHLGECIENSDGFQAPFEPKETQP